MILFGCSNEDDGGSGERDGRDPDGGQRGHQANRR